MSLFCILSIWNLGVLTKSSRSLGWVVNWAGVKDKYYSYTFNVNVLVRT